MPLVTPNGFRPAPPFASVAAKTETAQGSQQLLLSPDVDVESLGARLEDLELVSIAFPTFSDGRGFSLARRLRAAGYKGHLRASGHVISDQFRYALDCGFDDVEISDELAVRQPEADWIEGASQDVGYRDRLRGLPRPDDVAMDPSAGRYRSQDGVFEQRVTHVEHFTDGLFGFRITRPASFRFRSGEFAMIGLPNAAKPVFRAYSIASPAWGEELEFYSIKVAGGPLTEHLKRIRHGDTVLLKNKATGTLVVDALLPGRRLFLFSTGTGIAPFASIIRDPETYDKFDQIVLTQTCRAERDLAYGRGIIARTKSDPLVSELVADGRLRFVTSLTREPHPLTGRITTLLETGQLFDSLDIDGIDPAGDRAMICGSLAMIKDTRGILQNSGFVEGSNARPGTFVVERAFVA